MASNYMALNIVLDGFPENVTADKRDKFLEVVNTKMVAKLGHKNFQVTLTTNNGLVSGAFVQFNNVDDADAAVAALNRFRFTTTSEWKTSFWADFAKYDQISETFVPPSSLDDAKEVADLKANRFVLDEASRPQFIVKGGEQFDVEYFWWNTSTKVPDLLRKPNGARDDFCAQWSEIDRRKKLLSKGMPKEMPMWSPQGTFLVTAHPSGIRFWGGDTMAPVSEIPVENVSAVQVSEGETYCVVYAVEYSFWKLMEGRRIRSIPGARTASGESAYKYNSSDEWVCFAHVKAEGSQEMSGLMVYEAETMKLQTASATKLTHPIPGLVLFEWSPYNPNVLGCVVQGDSNVGWSVSFLEWLPQTKSFKTLVSRNFLQADNLLLQWSGEGMHAVTKVKKGSESTYNVFVVAPPVYCAALPFEVKREPLRLTWAKLAPAFSMHFGPTTSGDKQAVAFFTCTTKACTQIGELIQYEGESMFWSPKGTHAVALNGSKFTLEFFNVEAKKVAIVGRADHPEVTHVVWEPAGRYVTTVCSALKCQFPDKTGYKVWTPYGDPLYTCSLERFSHFAWRPQPHSLLSAKDYDRIRKELPTLSARFADEEAENARKKAADEVKRREILEKKFQERMNAVMREVSQRKLVEKREQLIASAPAMRRQRELLKRNNETVTETTVVTEVVSETAVNTI